MHPRALDGHLVSAEKITTGDDRAFVEQCMAFRRAIVGHSQDILFCAKNETSNIVRVFDDHHRHEGQALVEHLTDNDRPLSLVLAGY